MTIKLFPFYVIFLLFFIGCSNHSITSAQYDVVNVVYKKPTDEQLQKSIGLFSEILTKGVREGSDKDWAELGFLFKINRVNSIDYAVISAEGHGIYQIKLNSKRNGMVLEAPHSNADKYTGDITTLMFKEGPWQAAAWNTLSREAVDLAHEPVSFFNAFSIAVAQSFKEPRIMQPHGFNAKSHKIDADIIFSAAKYRKLSPEYKSISKCLRYGLPKYKIYDFNDEIDELGGYTNENAKAFYKANPNGKFFHIEMDIALREALLHQQDLRNAITDCLQFKDRD